jgi:hypothetical protein
VADVAYALNSETLASGEYDTLSEGEDEFGFVGCQTASTLIRRYAARYYYVGEGAQGHEYYADACDHACQHAVVYRPVFLGPYLTDRGADVGFGVHICKAMWRGTQTRGDCIAPH